MELHLSQLELQVHLQNVLGTRCRSNSRYSLRAFAKTIGIDPSTVSQILSGKRKVSSKMANKICERVGWPASASQVSNDANYFLLSQDAFAVISDWYHYAILDLTTLKGFRKNYSWIAAKLGISQAEAQIAVDRLKRLGMLVESGGTLKKGQRNYSNYSDGQTSSAHKEYQRQIIRKAQEAVDNCPAESKDITCITIAANSAKMKQAREKIKKFRRELCDFLEDGAGDSVHVLAVQFFPLTKYLTERK